MRRGFELKITITFIYLRFFTKFGTISITVIARSKPKYQKMAPFYFEEQGTESLRSPYLY